MLAATLVLALAAAGPSIGVGSVSERGDACAAMPGPRWAPGSLLTLVQPDPPQSRLTATVEDVVTSCGRLERAMVPGPYYRLGHLSTNPESGTIWVAFGGNLRSQPSRTGAIVLRLDASYPNLQVRSCTSREGVHLTVWMGPPLRSRRLWHEYYYLGYDVEPSCKDADTRGPDR
jgi:hypothetical protein